MCSCIVHTRLVPLLWVHDADRVAARLEGVPHLTGVDLAAALRERGALAIDVPRHVHVVSVPCRPRLPPPEQSLHIVHRQHARWVRARQCGALRCGELLQVGLLQPVLTVEVGQRQPQDVCQHERPSISKAIYRAALTAMAPPLAAGRRQAFILACASALAGRHRLSQ
eukprot:scaffold628_cov71-Phaeocystis_antarctica.AAC.4